MNKQHLILPFVLISTLLVSCGGGKTLSSAEAFKRANTITAFHENGAFVYPSDSVTFTLAITDLPMAMASITARFARRKAPISIRKLRRAKPAQARPIKTSPTISIAKMENIIGPKITGPAKTTAN